jgi:uncharacterized protein YpmS
MISLPELDIKKMIVVSLISFMFVYTDSFILLPMQIRAVKANKQNRARLEGQIKALKNELEILKNSRIEAAKEKKLEIKVSINEDQVPLLMQNISNIANKNEVKIMQIRPVKEVRPDIAQSLGSLAPLSIIMDLSCDYHNCGKFISLLESAKQFVKVSELRIMPGDVSFSKQSVYMIIITYVKK